jgi:serine/threonine-protein kinase
LGGRYEILSLIGAGGMGEVWRARHEVLDKVVAVKLLRAPTELARDRFLHEARTLATLHHPSIVEVYDFGETEAAVPYFVMAFLEGESLADRMERDFVTAEEAVALALPLLGGLAAAHAQGVVHRDIKPENVFLARTLTGERPTLVDFGIARSLSATAGRMTVEGTFVGTPEYMAPEVVRDEVPDGRADLWGLALTLYEAITGLSPFRAKDLVASFHKILDVPVPSPPRVHGLDDALWAILERALRIRREERYESADAMAAALRAWAAAREHGIQSVRKAVSTLAPPPSPASLEVDPLSIAPTQGPRSRWEDDDGDQGPRRTLDAMIRTKLGKKL